MNLDHGPSPRFLDASQSVLRAQQEYFLRRYGLLFVSKDIGSKDPAELLT